MKPKIKPLPPQQEIKVRLPLTETDKLKLIEQAHNKALEKRKQK